MNTIVENIVDEFPKAKDVDNSLYRIRIENLPVFFGMTQVRKFLQKNFPNIKVYRLKTMKHVAIFSVNNKENALLVIDQLNKMQVKNYALKAKQIAEEVSQTTNIVNKTSQYKSAVELVTPLAHLSYSQQLQLKFDESKLILQKLLKEVLKTGTSELKKYKKIENILPSPCITNYRNKCEFSIAEMESDKKSNFMCIGFVAGKMANKEYTILTDIDNCTNLTKNTIKIVQHFQKFINNFDSQLKPFNEFTREGFWKMLTIRDFLGDCMMIVTVHPLSNIDLLDSAKQAVVKEFIKFGNLDQQLKFRVTSLYWQTIDNASDPKIFEHLAGSPYVYENLLEVKFRISPSTFFQTNTKGAELLYTKIGDLLDLPKINLIAESTELVENFVDDINGNDDINNNGDEIETNLQINSFVNNEETIVAKRLKLSEDEKIDSSVSSVVLLDICCGAGTISICLMKRLKIFAEKKKTKFCFGVVGVELIKEAVDDAKRNAIDNGFSTNQCRYLNGQAEIIFKDLQYYMPEGCNFNTAKILGILDPPRAGVSSKVIIGCRKLKQMKQMVFVSCDPKAAMKNLVDLCRPTSNKYEGEPFKIISIQPIDMFPQTEHFEWIVLLKR